MTDNIDCVLPVKHTHASLNFYINPHYSDNNVVFTYKVFTHTNVQQMTCVLVVTMSLARGGLKPSELGPSSGTWCQLWPGHSHHLVTWPLSETGHFTGALSYNFTPAQLIQNVSTFLLPLLRCNKRSCYSNCSDLTPIKVYQS